MDFDVIGLYNIAFACTMPLYFVGTKKLNFLVYPITAFPVVLGAAFYFHLLDFIPSQHLIMAYTLIGTIFIYTLVVRRKWDITQAIPITMILVMAGSLYWEIPYHIRNAFLVGFEWDWILHASSLISVFALLFFIGLSPASSTRNKLLLLTLGFAVSIVMIIYYPVPPKVGSEDIWDSPQYLLNRIIDTAILFSIFNTVQRPVRGIIKI